jgi:hypothetical protein
MDFAALWRGWFPDVPPVGHLLRDAYPERWLRVHSLPGSKRYAGTDAEWGELLRRMNAVATDVLGEGACALVEPAWAEDEWGAPVEATWRSGAFDALLRRVADDETRAVFVALDSGRVFAPYDGGADLFLRDAVERDAFRARYGAWLSAHPLGL